jgi:hypothetical protein
MTDFLSYFFYPNPYAPQYSDPKVLFIALTCVALIIAGLVTKSLFSKSADKQFKKLSASWPRAMLWFGVIGLIMLIARTESVSYVSMRLWWVFWLLFGLLYIVFQVKQYGTKYYKVISTGKSTGKPVRYLPKKKK